MKKFIKSKIDYNARTSRGSPTILAESPPNVGKEKAMPDMQPPLPLDPPPPNEIPSLTLEPKQEIEDIEYPIPGKESSESLNHEGVSAGLNGYEENDGNKLKPMCRDFVRGRCTRPGTCKFSHKCDVLQLAGVYTFCRNFQNRVCIRPNCKFVHATVFEEQHWYRTGELPPHVLGKHKMVNILPPPPPPPPTQVNYAAPVPEAWGHKPKKSKVFSAVGRAAPVPKAWGHETIKPKNCEETEFRLKYNLERLDYIKYSNFELSKKILEVDEKIAKVLIIIIAILEAKDLM
ncbi:unnamed protein product [Parnassius apollo]|uniref:(apollo) hypothetical protein n=1 Tax=Parnassius apollo TaxID=110799 RepID=A0A8S3XRS0_PARAO|nr:unnamed protein product [Parnassius apollo]